MGKKAGYWVSSHSVTSFDMSSGMSVSEKVGKRTTVKRMMTRMMEKSRIERCGSELVCVVGQAVDDIDSPSVNQSGIQSSTPPTQLRCSQRALTLKEGAQAQIDHRISFS